MSEDVVAEEEIAELVQRNREAAAAYIRGDAHRYLELVRASDDHTLTAPLGGRTMHPGDRPDEAVVAASAYFRGGEADLEVAQTCTSGQVVVLVGVERQHGQYDGLPDQDLSLRMTLVYRREGDQRWLVHRRADLLVHSISVEQLSVLLRGRAPDRGATRIDQASADLPRAPRIRASWSGEAEAGRERCGPWTTAVTAAERLRRPPSWLVPLTPTWSRHTEVCAV